MKVLLEKFQVSCIGCSDGLLYTGNAVYITFISLHEDVPLLDISGAKVMESVKGISASITGRSTYSAIIQSLSTTHKWHFRAFACNQVGCEAPSLFLPSPLILFAAAPSIVQDLSLVRKTDKSITVGWNAPVSHGGYKVVGFFIEFDTSPSIASQVVRSSENFFIEVENFTS